MIKVLGPKIQHMTRGYEKDTHTIKTKSQKQGERFHSHHAPSVLKKENEVLRLCKVLLMDCVML